MFVSFANIYDELSRIDSAIGTEGAKEDGHDHHDHEHDHDHDHHHHHHDDHKHGKCILIIRVDNHFACVWLSLD